MAINKKLIHFNTKENFLTLLENNNILETSICFIKSTKEIWTHGLLYSCDLEAAKEEIYELLTPIFEDIYRVVGMRSHIGEEGEIIVGDDLKQEVLDEFINMLDSKVDKEDGKSLSSNDFTDTDKAKLDGIESGAQMNPTKVSQLTNDLKYQTATQVENRMAILYESLDSQLVDEYTHLDNKKVDKVSGKQLSTEDFTTLLKQKLEGLTNYNDAALDAKIEALKSRLDTLVGSGDVTAVIDTFQEIEAFLQGITNTQTLTGLLQEMKGEIVAMIPTDNAKVVGFNLSAGEIYKLSGLQGSYLLSSRGTNSEICSLIWFSTYGSGGYQRTTSRVIYSKGIEAYTENDVDIASVYVKNVHFASLSCFLILLNNNAIPTSEVVNDLPTNVATITADINRLISAAGTSSQFLKADGSVDSTAYVPNKIGSTTEDKPLNPSDIATQLFRTARYNSGSKIGYVSSILLGGANKDWRSWELIGTTGYENYPENLYWRCGISEWGDLKTILDSNNYSSYALPLTGGTINSSGHSLKIKSNTEEANYIDFVYGEITKASVGYSSTYGAVVYNYACNKYLGIKDDGTPHFNHSTLWHAGNDGAGSGLDADLLDGKQPADLNVGSANVLKGTNSTTTPSYSLPSDFSQSYKVTTTRYSDGSNNYPVSLIVSGAWQNWEMAIRETTARPNAKLLFRVSGSNDWYPWREIAFTDSNVASADKLTTKQLTNEDLNDIKDVNFSSYRANSSNTCFNKPDGVASFTLQVFAVTDTVVSQILTSYYSSGVTNVYKRIFVGNTWTPWKKMLTEDDITSLTNRIAALETKIN